MTLIVTNFIPLLDHHLVQECCRSPPSGTRRAASASGSPPLAHLFRPCHVCQGFWPYCDKAGFDFSGAFDFFLACLDCSITSAETKTCLENIPGVSDLHQAFLTSSDLHHAFLTVAPG